MNAVILQRVVKQNYIKYKKKKKKKTDRRIMT